MDVFTPEKRSEVMSRIRGRDTKPELALRKMLHGLGYRFTVNGPKNRTLPGRPDIVLPKHSTVIFVHGCFWHGHEHCPYFRLVSMPLKMKPFCMRLLVCFAWFLALLVPASADPAKPLQKLDNCVLIPTEWADGDSFRIRSKEGQEHTIRLYGADCLEWHISDDADAQRLRKQRRYFGITEARSGPQDAIALAKDFGKQAADKTAALLDKPFTVHTFFRDALGDGLHQRYYGFVTNADGKDLAEELVKSGLARAFGVYADGPDGRSPDDYKGLLADLELQAAKRGMGIWKDTNWEKLPLERLEQRKDDNQINAAAGKQPLPLGFKLDPNKSAIDELLKLPNIGEELANRIREGSPYKNLDDLDRVDGIGPKTLELLKPYLVFPESNQ